ncbi:MAG TPA: DUF6766 family protein [Solirubrobacteraceae bacterium]|nr:DUF6766 family protein [Solirubrobacteraceae bacterium]
MRRFLYENGLGLFFGAIFLATVIGQAFVGHADFNHLQAADQNAPVSLGRYVTSSDFAADVLENWQSEYLQFSLYIFGTVWLLQRGSPESKKPGEAGPGSDEDQQLGPHAHERSPAWAGVGGFRQWTYSNSLIIVMTSIWIASWTGQAIAGRVAYNAEQIDNREAPLNLLSYVGSSDFWDRTLQNWQSEFLAVGSMAVLAIYLRQRGSPESKPVGAAHDVTGEEG